MTADQILSDLHIEDKILASRLARYNEEVMAANAHVNLTGIKEEEESLIKNVYDSLTVYEKEWFPHGGRLLDLGTGAGFPGVVLALLRPDMSVTLMDAVQKKLLFIERTAEAMGIENVKCLHMRAEDGGRRKKLREMFDVVTARAVKDLPVITEWAMPFVKVGGIFVAMKGPGGEEELRRANRILQEMNGVCEHIKTLILPSGERRTILYIRKTAPCPKTFPRKVGLAEKNPIL